MDSDEDIRKVPLNESDAEVRVSHGVPNDPVETIPEHVDEKLDKKAQKKLESERKAEEKRLKKQEREAQKHQGGGGSGAQFMRKSFNHLSNMLTPKIIKKNNEKPKENAVQCKVTLLDGSEYSTDIDKYAYGQHLVDKVLDHMNLVEKEYFSLTFIGKRNILFWLRHERRIIKQRVDGSEGPWTFDMRVKFYTPEPTIMQEDITRYQLCLQLRNDIATGKLPCTFVTYAYLGSYTVQSELGDYEPDPNSSNQIDYIQDVVFAPSQTDELLEKIVELHKTHKGQMPAEAELNFLENAKRLQMYGMHFAPARDYEMVLIWLGVYYGGVVVVRDGVMINKFPWPTILKLSYKNKKFYLKIRAAELQQFENTLGFQMESHTHAKNFWRLVMEHHIFFRLKNAKDADNLSKSFSVVHLNSKDRFSGRTHYQTKSHRIHRTQPSFERSGSRNTFRSLGGVSMASDRMAVEGQHDELLNEIGKVSVLAGTGSNVNRLAYVKTVVPENQIDNQYNEEYDSEAYSKPKGGKKKKTRSNDYEDKNIPMNGDVEEMSDKKKKKKKKSSKSEDPSLTEYKTERKGMISTTTSNEVKVRREPGEDYENYDEALSKAIKNVTELDHGLAVKNIEVDTDQLKKKKKKKKHVGEEFDM